MPEAQQSDQTEQHAPLSFWQKISNVSLKDRFEAFAYKHPIWTVGIGTALLAGVPLGLWVGIPALAVGQAFAVFAGWTAEIAVLMGGVGMEIGAIVNHLSAGKTTMLFPSGQVVKGNGDLVRSAQAMQRQFDRIVQRRDFDVKEALSGKDKIVLRAYQELWRRSKLSQFIAKRLNRTMEIARVAPAAELQQLEAQITASGEGLKNLGIDPPNPVSPKFNLARRAYEDAELAASQTPEPVVVFGKQLQLVRKLV